MMGRFLQICLFKFDKDKQGNCKHFPVRYSMFQSNFYNLEFYLKSNIALNFQKIICRIWANQEKDKRILFLRGSGRSHGSLEIYKSIYKVYTSTSLQGLQGLQVYKVYKSTRSTSLQVFRFRFFYKVSLNVTGSWVNWNMWYIL